MSQQSQQKFLERFDKLLKERAGVYRNARANKVSHVFVVSKRAIHKGIADTVRRKFETDATKHLAIIKAELDKDVNNFVTKIIGDLNRLEASSKADNAAVRIRRLGSGQYDARYIFFASKANEGSLTNVYRKIYSSYIDDLEDLATKVGEVIKSATGKNLGNNAKKYWNLEHGENQGAVESQVADAFNQSLEGLGDMPRAEVLGWLERQGVDLRIIRNTKTSTMEVHIGSKYGNIGEGIISRGRKSKLRTEVRLALSASAEHIVDLPGSDSFKTIVRKKAIVNTTKPFKRIKGATVKTENTAIKNTITTAVSKKVTNKSKKAAGKGRVKARKTRTVKGVASSPLALITLINKDLPKVVQSNMGPPRLENRSGRFASSVRIVSAATTAQGFPSFAYTYQQEPYRVFEEGSSGNWSNRDRDPRRLIDQSIREIAAQYAIGRFYTRRV